MCAFGRYAFDAITPGEYTVVASGYATAARPVRVDENPAPAVDLALRQHFDGEDRPTGRHARPESAPAGRA